jgi:hypothetical protein
MSLRDAREARASDWVRWASVTSVRAAASHPEGHPVAVADAVRFCVALMHPAVTARMVDGYAVERRYRYTVHNAGLEMTYEGTHRPLSAYFDALEGAGLVVEALREPAALRDDGSPYVNFVHLRGRLLGGGPASSRGDDHAR